MNKDSQSLNRLYRALAFALVLLTGPLHAAFIDVDRAHDIVNDSDGGCTLREAIRAANDNVAVDGCTAGTDNQLDIVLIEVQGPINLSSEIQITGSVLLAGSGTLPQPVTINAGTNQRIFYVNQADSGDDSLALNNLILIGGAPSAGNGGAVYIERTWQAEITAVDFIGNSAMNGGAIYLEGVAANNLLIAESGFYDNTASAQGGGIYANNSIRDALEIRDNRFINNAATFGGAMSISESLDDPVVYDSNLFKDNFASSSGGALVLSTTGDGQDYLIEDSAFLSNTAFSSGGAILATLPNTTVKLNNSTLAFNAANTGAAMKMNSSNLLLNFSTVVHNHPNSADGSINIQANAVSPVIAIAGSVVAHPGAHAVCAGDTGFVLSLGNSVQSDASCQLTGSGDQTADPKLSGLTVAGNGLPGFVPTAHSPGLDVFAGAPCIDTEGDAINFDQQGLPRATDGDGNGTPGCDAGALEAPADTDLIYADVFGF